MDISTRTRPLTPWLFARERQAAGTLGLLPDRPGSRAPRPRDRPGAARADPQPGDRVAGAVTRLRREWRHMARSSIRPARSWPRSRRTGRASPPHHDLHAFHAFRRMDEILCANYMLFDDVVRDTTYDLWVGDEAWEVDHFLHENPERKIAPYALPHRRRRGPCPSLPTRGTRARSSCVRTTTRRWSSAGSGSRDVRDRSVFIGGFAELPDASARGRGCRACATGRERLVRPAFPTSCRSTRRPTDAARRGCAAARLRHRLPALPRRGRAAPRSAGDLLELTAEAFALRAQGGAGRADGDGDRAAARPRTARRTSRAWTSVGVRRPDCFAHLACADAAVVQGGLSTTMELVAARRPFVYFPLARHWEQQHFVAHRLDHYGAGVRMD